MPASALRQLAAELVLPRFKHGDALTQRVDQIRHLALAEMGRDAPGAVPVERCNLDQQHPLDPGAGVVDLRLAEPLQATALLSHCR